MKLHIGCGPMILGGWVNVDRELHPGVNLVIDACHPLPFVDRSVALVFAEHFIEHLEHPEGARFLQECFRLLDPDGGVVRLSTPNLDYTWSTHYQYPAGEETRRTGAFNLNRAFHDWGHKFLYNDVVLRDALYGAGFREVRFFRYGESDVEMLRNLEQHEVNRYRWTEACPDVIIAQGYR